MPTRTRLSCLILETRANPDTTLLDDPYYDAGGTGQDPTDPTLVDTTTTDDIVAPDGSSIDSTTYDATTDATTTDGSTTDPNSDPTADYLSDPYFLNSVYIGN